MSLMSKDFIFENIKKDKNIILNAHTYIDGNYMEIICRTNIPSLLDKLKEINEINKSRERDN